MWGFFGCKHQADMITVSVT